MVVGVGFSQWPRMSSHEENTKLRAKIMAPLMRVWLIDFIVGLLGCYLFWGQKYKEFLMLLYIANQAHGVPAVAVGAVPGNR